MKKFSFFIAFAGVLLLLPYGCDQIKSTVTYTANDPVYMPFSEFRATKAAKAAAKMVNPGKICLYGDYLFISEVSKGIHIIDNSQPANPKSVAFVELPGNIDITINNNILYADSFIDLVLFDVSNPDQPKECGRALDVFPNVLPSTGNDYPIREIDWSKGVVVGWEVKTITEKEEFYPNYPCFGCYYLDYGAQSWNSAGKRTSSSPGVTSFTGSMSRFAVFGEYLYVVNSSMLKVFLLHENAVIKVNEQYLSWNVETIFPYDGKLFLGTTNGLMIFGLTDPSKPNWLSSVAHIVGCDPVVVQDDYAYVTIRGGNLCGQNLSLLDVIDISNPLAPQLKASYNMKEPFGLGIDDNLLFVCDQGLTVFDASDPIKVGAKLIKQFGSIHGFDVIPYNQNLILIGNDGLYQYDYSDMNNIKQVSVIKVDK
ncbi:MAG: hypothetical protein LBC84_00625 [Prevotellaceae bacterium]|jgi:hypothetical protein|nr:hypothetical protein [Prevotellaceae bacterium]